MANTVQQQFPPLAETSADAPAQTAPRPPLALNRYARLALAAVMLVLAAFIVLFTVFMLVTPKPVTIERAANDISIVFSAGRTLLAFGGDCMTVRWETRNVRAVRLYPDDVPLQGEASVCGATPRLQVTLDNGRTLEYRIKREVLFDQPATRVTLLAALALVFGAVMAEGTLPKLWGRTAPARLIGRATGAVRELVRELAQPVDDGAGNALPWVIGLIGVTIVGVVMRLMFINMHMRADEAGTYFDFLNLPFLRMISWYPVPNNHLFHTLVASLSIHVLGSAPWTIRLPAFLAGVLIVPATYFAGRALYSRPAGLLAAALIAASSGFIEYSTNARGYTLQFLFFMLMLILAAYLKTHRNTAGWALYALFATLGFYTIPTMLHPYGAVTSWLFVSIIAHNDGKHRLLLLRDFVVANFAAGLTTILLYTPIFLSDSGVQSVVANPHVQRWGGSEFYTRTPIFFGQTWWYWMLDIPQPLVLLTAAGLVASIVFHLWITRDRVPLQAPTLVWSEALLLIQRSVPFIRVMLFMLPLYAIFSAAGLLFLAKLARFQRFRGWRYVTVAAALAFAIGIGSNVARSRTPYYSLQTGAFPDVEQIVLFLEPELRVGDRILITDMPYHIFRYYLLQQQISDEYVTKDASAVPGRIFLIVNRRVDGETLQRVVERGRVPIDRYQAPQLVRRFEIGDIYLLEPK